MHSVQSSVFGVCVCLCSVCRGILITSSHTCSPSLLHLPRSLIPPTNPLRFLCPAIKAGSSHSCRLPHPPLPLPSPPSTVDLVWPGFSGRPPSTHPYTGPPTAWSKQQQGPRWCRLIPRRDIHDGWPPSRKHGPELLAGLMSTRTRCKVGFYTRRWGGDACRLQI